MELSAESVGVDGGNEGVVGGSVGVDGGSWNVVGGTVDLVVEVGDSAGGERCVTERLGVVEGG